MSKIHPLTILKAKTDTEEKKYKSIPDELQQPPFCMILVAPSKSGKSNLLTNLLYNKNFGMTDVFEEIYYISPTVMIDKTLKKNVREDDNIIKIYKEEDLEHVDDILDDIKRSQEDKDENERGDVLVILDDMIEYFSNHGKINSLPALSRHYGITVILCSQTMSNIPIRCRKNASSYIISNITNENDKNSIIFEIGSKFGKDFEKNLDEATKDKFNFLYCDNREMKLYHNFTKLLWEK